jgi:hypothetical protein
MKDLILILKFFIRCLLVGVREGLWVGISLSYKWKQIGVFFRRIVYVYIDFLATKTSHITALKIKDYIISSLLLVRHYLRLVVDDHSYSGPGLSGSVARSRRIYSWKFYFFAFFEFIACHFDGNA